MIKTIYTFLFALLLIGCQSESTSKTVDNIDSSNYATPVYEANPDAKKVKIKSSSFTSEGFSVTVPTGFTAQSSIASNTYNNDFDSYFFISPDQKVKLYVYAPQGFGTPNDIIFPNEKISVNYSKQGNTERREWQLDKNKQFPYHRKYEEVRTPQHITITGFYFKDAAAHDKYSSDYKAFKNSLKRQN